MADAVLNAVNNFYIAYNENKLELLDETLAPGYVAHVNTAEINGAESAKGFMGHFLTTFPDAHYTVHDLIRSAEGDKVITRWSCTGTHQGAFAGIEPTGKAVTMIGITIFKIVDGKIAELWGNWDVAGLLNQLKG